MSIAWTSWYQESDASLAMTMSMTMSMNLVANKEECGCLDQTFKLSKAESNEKLHRFVVFKCLRPVIKEKLHRSTYIQILSVLIRCYAHSSTREEIIRQTTKSEQQLVNNNDNWVVNTNILSDKKSRSSRSRKC